MQKGINPVGEGADPFEITIIQTSDRYPWHCDILTPLAPPGCTRIIQHLNPGRKNHIPHLKQGTDFHKAKSPLELLLKFCIQLTQGHV